MHKKYFFIALLVVTFVGTGHALTASAALTVSPGQSIQSAVNAASSGSTITISPGTYNETVAVGKALTLVGSGDSTVVKAFIISAPNVTVKNFYVTGSSDTGVLSTAPHTYIENVHAYNNPNGGIILQIGSDDSTVINSKFEHNGHFGIKVNSSRNLIKNNEVWATYYSTDVDGMYGFGADNVWDGNYVHDLVYTSSNPHIDCFQTWGNLPGGVGISGTTIFQNNRCILPNTANSVDEATAGMTLGGGGSGTLIVRNNIFDTYLGIGQFANGSPNLNVLVYNNTFLGHAFQSPQYSNSAVYSSYMSTIKQFTGNLIVGKNSQEIILINGATMPGTNANNWFYTAGKSVTFGNYNASKDIKDADPLLGADYRLASSSAACNVSGSYVGAYPCAGTTILPLPSSSVLPTLTPAPSLSPSPSPVVPSPSPIHSIVPSPVPQPVPSPTVAPTVSASPVPGSTKTFTATLFASADTLITSRNPSGSYEKYNELMVDASPVRISYLRFDLSSLADKALASAKLKFFVTDGSAGRQNFKECSSPTWPQGMTYNNRLGLDSRVIASVAYTQSWRWKEVDISDFVNGHKGQSVCIGVDTVSKDEMDMYSLEGPTTYRPRIMVTYRAVASASLDVPVPTLNIPKELQKLPAEMTSGDRAWFVTLMHEQLAAMIEAVATLLGR